MSREFQSLISRPRFTIRHTATGACQFEPHSHSGLTATAALSGAMQVEIDGQPFQLHQGQLILTDMGRIHSARSAGVEFVSICFEPVLVLELIAEMGAAAGTGDIIAEKGPFADPEILDLLTSVARESLEGMPGRDAMLEGMARQLAVHIARAHLEFRRSSTIELSRAGPVDRRLRRAIEFMHANFDRELSLEEIAAAAFLSEYHFARIFKQITGVTPHVYLGNVRLEQARKLLLETDLPIVQIASRVGYQSQSHFTRMFKLTTGVTPLVFRNSRANPSTS